MITIYFKGVDKFVEFVSRHKLVASIGVANELRRVCILKGAMSVFRVVLNADMYNLVKPYFRGD